MSDLSRRLFIGGAAGATAVGVSMMDGGNIEAQYLGPKLRLSVLDLGVQADGTTDDGAILTQALVDRFGTFESNTRTTPVEIDFGDLTLHLKSPIIINQSFIEFVGSPKFYCDGIDNAIIVSADRHMAIVVGTKIRGTFTGYVQKDAVLYEQGSQGLIDVRNSGWIGGAVVHVRGSYRTDVRVHTPGEGIVCYHAYRETVLQLPAGPANTINSKIFVVAYDCYGAAVMMEESQGFDLGGDIERAKGPGVDLYNCQNGLIYVYTELNGLSATNTGYDTPDDIRIRSGPGLSTPNSDGNIIRGARIGGEQLTLKGQRVTPNSVHIIHGYWNVIEGNVLGGNIKLEGEAYYTLVGRQSRFGGSVTDLGQYTTDNSVIGKSVTMAARYRRFVVDALTPAGAVIGSDDRLLHLYGMRSFGAGTTTGHNFTGSIDISNSSTSGRVNFPTPEPDGYYFPTVSLLDVSGGSASASYKIRNLSTSGFDIVLDAAPGGGQTIRAHYLIVRTN